MMVRVLVRNVDNLLAAELVTQDPSVCVSALSVLGHDLGHFSFHLSDLKFFA